MCFVARCLASQYPGLRQSWSALRSSNLEELCVGCRRGVEEERASLGHLFKPNSGPFFGIGMKPTLVILVAFERFFWSSPSSPVVPKAF